MIICKKCKSEMPDDTYFCEKCGEQMRGQSATATPTVRLGSNVVQQKQPLAPDSVGFTSPKASTTANYTTVPARPAVDVSQQKLDVFDGLIYPSGPFSSLTGRFSIYGDRIEFQPSAVNILSLKMSDEKIVIPLKEITAVNATKIIFIAPGIQIILRSGKEYIVQPPMVEVNRIIGLIQTQLSIINYKN